ncbi:MAG: hypothetical protein Rubg2KO_17910 [Rubricoccaceae bacterium]
MNPIVALLCVALALGMMQTSQAQDGIPAMGNRDLSFVASTLEARFYSDFWLNLHDYLYGRAREPDVVQVPGGSVECIAALPETQQNAWRAAEAFYEAEMPERHHRRDPLIRAIRHRFAETATEHEPLADSTLEILTAAAPAYRACLWGIHDARNRERIAELVRMVVAHGPALRYRLERAYRADWPAGIVVDIAPYAAFANTSGGLGQEPHTMLSNTHPDLVGWSGLEILFHEGSHSMFNARHGEVARSLRAASMETGVERPSQLWHALSFHTSGRIVQEMAAAEGDEYTPYYIRRNIFSEFVEVFDAHWNSYLEGEMAMDEAALAVMRALGAEAEE